MFQIEQEYVCTQCDNSSWEQEECHGKPMEPVCECGSGRPVSECHGEKSSEHTS